MGRNIKIDYQEGRWGINWIDLVQDKDRWRHLQTRFSAFGFHKKRGSSVLTKNLLAFQKGHCSNEIGLFCAKDKGIYPNILRPLNIRYLQPVPNYLHISKRSLYFRVVNGVTLSSVCFMKYN
jgi:hypothetical protein